MNPPKKEYVQFSKRVTIAVTALWAVFRLITLLLIGLRPETAQALAAFQQGADDVMMAAIGFYCGNSVAEKGILGYFKARERSSIDISDEEESVG